MTVGSNPMSALAMTPRERRDELCSLLAAGLLRLRLRSDPVSCGPTREKDATHRA